MSAATVKPIKKRRWKKEEKKERRVEKEAGAKKNDRQKSSANKPTKKMKPPALSFPERLIQCATKAESTNAVTMKSGNKGVRVITTSNIAFSDQESSSSTMIVIKPLLILDLNGILCHRIRNERTDDFYPHLPYRKGSGANIAGTPIIPRLHVEAFLNYLDAHFCLAVWTSAKSKTAKLLLRLLFPESIRERLLFVWSQNQCLSVPNPDDIGRKPIFVKSLVQVWNQYPLWNASNTLLVDDSPEKCPDVMNTLHPPPLNGKQQQSETLLLSDEENGAHQMEFFSQVAQQHFGVARKTWSSRKEQTAALSEFLNRTATSHMGWRGTI
jgi:hypothetical protein